MGKARKVQKKYQIGKQGQRNEPTPGIKNENSDQAEYLCATNPGEF